MMGAVRRWLLGIVLTAFAGGAACRLAPSGREQAGVRLAAGLLLLLALLRPLQALQPEREAAVFGPLPTREETEEACRRERLRALAGIIEERTAAYICDRAASLGYALTCRVTTSVGEEGVPLPDRVYLQGVGGETVTQMIREEVGIPAAHQIWQEGAYGEGEEGEADRLP